MIAALKVDRTNESPLFSSKLKWRRRDSRTEEDYILVVCLQSGWQGKTERRKGAWLLVCCEAFVKVGRGVEYNDMM